LNSICAEKYTKFKSGEGIRVKWNHDWHLDSCFPWPLLCFLAYFALEKHHQPEGRFHYPHLLWLCMCMHIFARLCLPTHRYSLTHTHPEAQLRLKNLCIILLGENMLWSLRSRKLGNRWQDTCRTPCPLGALFTLALFAD